jgi:hypothetical protein
MKDLPYSLYAQENGVFGRVVQSFHGPSLIALREMDREIIKTAKALVDERRSGSGGALKHARRLLKIMPERSESTTQLSTISADIRSGIRGVTGDIGEPAAAKRGRCEGFHWAVSQRGA